MNLPLSLLLSAGLALLAVSAHGANDRPRTVIFMGDSLTSGYGLDVQETYPALIEEKSSALGWDVRSVNSGVSGETSAGGLRRVDWILRQPVDVFVLGLGANDGLRGLEPAATYKNLQAILNRVREKHPEARLVIAGMLVPPNMGPEYSEKFAALFPRLAEQNDAALIPFLLEGVGGIPEMNLPDGIHPSAEGHQVMARTVWETLEPVLRELVDS